MSKRFVSWSAVSSLPQAEKISLSDQREVNHRHIERHGGIVVAELEVDESRDIPELSEACERIEAYATLREMIRAKSFDVLICLTRSRLGRVMAMVETIAELCRRANIVIYETESPPSHLNSDSGHSADLLTGAVRSWRAQSEVDELRRRHRMGMMGKFKRGEFLSRVPFGWRLTYDANSRANRPVIDPAAAKTIRTALIDLYLTQGWGADYIVAELNQRGMFTATGKHWTKTSIHILWRMMWRYAGYSEINHYSKHRPYARERGTWPPIITEEELHRLIEERGSRHGKRGHLAQTYRFSLIIWCAVCGTRMHMHAGKSARVHRDGSKNPRRYVSAFCRLCVNKPGRSVAISRIMPVVRAHFISLQDRANWHLYLETEDNDALTLDAEATALEKEIRKAEQNIYEADDKLIDGTFDSDRHTHQVKRLKDRIAQLQNDLTVLADRRVVYDHALQRESRLQEIAEHGLEYLDMEDERAANAKLRRLIRVQVRAGKQFYVEVL